MSKSGDMLDYSDILQRQEEIKKELEDMRLQDQVMAVIAFVFCSAVVAAAIWAFFCEEGL